MELLEQQYEKMKQIIKDDQDEDREEQLVNVKFKIIRKLENRWIEYK